MIRNPAPKAVIIIKTIERASQIPPISFSSLFSQNRATVVTRLLCKVSSGYHRRKWRASLRVRLRLAAFSGSWCLLFATNAPHSDSRRRSRHSVANCFWCSWLSWRNQWFIDCWHFLIRHRWISDLSLFAFVLLTPALSSSFELWAWALTRFARVSAYLQPQSLWSRHMCHYLWQQV